MMDVAFSDSSCVIFSRRTALRSIGGAVVGLVLHGTITHAGICIAQAAAPQRVTAWITVGHDNSIVVMASQSEMGQGATTTLAAAVAHELDVPWQNVRVEFATFAPDYRDPVYDWMFTGNSQSISSFYHLMRQMGAAAREMLIAAASQRIGRPTAMIQCSRGGLLDTQTGTRLTFGEVARAASKLPVPKQPVLRTDNTLEGRSLPRWDIPAKVDGSAQFGIDVSLPGLHVAAIRRAPCRGARLVGYDRAAIESSPGVHNVVELPDGLAVVADTYWRAHQALLEAEVQWGSDGANLSSEGGGLPSIYREKLASGPFFAHLTEGDASEVLKGAEKQLSVTYEVPFQAHATMEPMNCTAIVTPDRCEIWAPVQGVELVQFVAMQVTGLPSDKVTVHRTMIGGGFGRRLLADFVKQTLWIAKAVRRPVKLIWSREEDVTQDFYRPGILHRVDAGFRANGEAVGIAHRVVSPSQMNFIFPRAMLPKVTDWTQSVAPPEKMDTMSVEGLLNTPYSFIAQKVDLHRLEIDIPTSVWRTTGHGPNNFVLESVLDEIAVAARRDPFELRRSLLAGNQRALMVLESLEIRSHWRSPSAAGRARGVAFASAFGGYIGSVAEVSVHEKRISVHKIWSVVDCGRTLDPGIASSNIAGGIVWGLSGMRTAMTFDRGVPQQSNFDSFVPMHLWEVPETDISFIESGGKLGGTGELGPVPVHAAVCNAVYAATGDRIRTLPLAQQGYEFA